MKQRTPVDDEREDYPDPKNKTKNEPSQTTIDP